MRRASGLALSPYTLWVFPTSLRLAIERILQERGRQLALVDQVEFESPLSRIAASKAQPDLLGPGR
jgi:hypothetical protein